jgi:hypothetical protein
MSDDRVYVRFKGKTLGPLTTEKVHGLIKRGQITRMHELSSDGLAWTRAEDFGVFFAQRNSQQATHENPREPTFPAPSTEATQHHSQPRPGERPQDDIEWYAHFNKQSQGPITTDALYDLIDNGTISSKTLVWRSGFEDWRPLEMAIPERFQSETQPTYDLLTSGSIIGTGKPSLHFAKPLTEARGWTTFLAISGIVIGALNILYFIFVMIASANRSLTPLQGTERVAYGLSGIAMNGLFVAGAVLLLRYSASLKKGVFSTEYDLLASVHKLKTFWIYSGIVVLVLEVLLIGLIAVIAVIGAAVTDT